MSRYDSGQLVFGSHDLSALCYSCFSRPVMPPSTVYETAVPGRPGAVYRRRQLEPYDLPVTLYLRSASPEDVARVRHALAAMMLEPGEQRLVLPDDPTRYYMAAVSGASDIDALHERYPRAEITFRILDPVAYGQHRRQALASGRNSVLFGGTYPARPVVSISGNGSAVRVENRTGGRHVETAATVPAGRTARIDMALERTTVNGGDAAVTLASDYFECSGATVVHVSGSPSGGTIEWDERWL